MDCLLDSVIDIRVHGVTMAMGLVRRMSLLSDTIDFNIHMRRTMPCAIFK